MDEKVKEALIRIRPKLGSGDIQLVDINGKIVTVKYFEQVSACDIKQRGMITKDLVTEMLEEELRRDIPEIAAVIVI